MNKIITARLTEPYWFKLKNKCRYYDISMSEAMLQLLVRFATSKDLDAVVGIPEHGGYDSERD